MDGRIPGIIWQIKTVFDNGISVVLPINWSAVCTRDWSQHKGDSEPKKDAQVREVVQFMKTEELTNRC